jgi:hypothetical protein
MNEQTKTRHYSTMTEAEKEAWDAEIEADYQRMLSTSTRPSKRKHPLQLIGCPLEFLVDICRLTRGRMALIVGLHVFRRTVVCHSSTVTLDKTELAELGVDRKRGREALHDLANAGIVRLSRTGSGQKTEATLLWRPTPL